MRKKSNVKLKKTEGHRGGGGIPRTLKEVRSRQRPMAKEKKLGEREDTKEERTYVRYGVRRVWKRVCPVWPFP